MLSPYECQQKNNTSHIQLVPLRRIGCATEITNHSSDRCSGKSSRQNNQDCYDLYGNQQKAWTLWHEMEMEPCCRYEVSITVVLSRWRWITLGFLLCSGRKCKKDVQPCCFIPPDVYCENQPGCTLPFKQMLQLPFILSLYITGCRHADSDGSNVRTPLQPERQNTTSWSITSGHHLLNLTEPVKHKDNLTPVSPRCVHAGWQGQRQLSKGQASFRVPQNYIFFVHNSTGESLTLFCKASSK